MDFTINQLVGAFGAHSCSAFTLPPTTWLDCSVLADQSFQLFIAWTSLLATLGAHQLHWGLLDVQILHTTVAS
jgi:hypothetical protein